MALQRSLSAFSWSIGLILSTNVAMLGVLDLMSVEVLEMLEASGKKIKNIVENK